MRKEVENYLNTWQSRNVNFEAIQTIEDVMTKNEEEGYLFTQEASQVIFASLQYLGSSYARHEDSVDENIDCSTLVSQAHWEGSIVGVPFTAEGQRKAQTAAPINIEDIRPGDVLIKYPSLASSPDGQYNHVGLVFGKDRNERTWVIESNEKEGCVINQLDSFNPEGGVRRFCPNPETSYDMSLTLQCRRLAQLVPKFGRLGVKQYKKNQERAPHRGLDIYVPTGTQIVAPISGKILSYELPSENTTSIVITRPEGNERVVLGNIKISRSMLGKNISAGEQIGLVVEPSPISEVNYSPYYATNPSHLHFEYSRRVSENISFPGQIIVDNWLYENGLYKAKLGELLLPINI